MFFSHYELDCKISLISSCSSFVIGVLIGTPSAHVSSLRSEYMSFCLFDNHERAIFGDTAIHFPRQFFATINGHCLAASISLHSFLSALIQRWYVASSISARAHASLMVKSFLKASINFATVVGVFFVGHLGHVFFFFLVIFAITIK